LSPQIKRFGYEPDKIIGKNIDDFLFEEDRKNIFDTFLRIIEKGEDKEDKITFRSKNKDGDINFLEENSNIVTSDEGIKYITGVMREVTERKKGKQQLKKRKEEYKNIFENSPIGLLDCD